jgi:hypothetical protein
MVEAGLAMGCRPFPEALLTYADGRYVPVIDGLISPTVGGWAYFRESASGEMTPRRDTPVDVNLAPGWNMVGNPFDVPAALPSTVNGYYWNTSTDGYEEVSRIPTGGSGWIFSRDTESVTLAPVPTGARD